MDGCLSRPAAAFPLWEVNAMEQITLPMPPDAVKQAVWPVFVCSCAGTSEEIELPAPEAGAYLLLAPARGVLCRADEAGACRLSPGGALLLPPGDASVFTAEEDWQADVLALAGGLTASLLGETLAQGGPYFPRGGEAVRAAAAALRRPVDAMTASAEAYQLLMQLYGRSAPADAPAYPPLVQDAMAIIAQEYAYLYGVDDLAARLMVSKNHLIRVFSAAVGMPPGQYLTQVRIEAAKRLLRSPEATLDLVAAATGFSSAGYFGKVFRRETGVTPARYAAAARRPEPLPDDWYL